MTKNAKRAAERVDQDQPARFIRLILLYHSPQITYVIMKDSITGKKYETNAFGNL